MKNNIELSVIVPCYNERENIPLIASHFSKIMSKREDIEVILVNNGSNDGSSEEFAKLQGFKIVEVPVNKGYGFGILSGLNEANGRLLCWTHADMQTNPNDILKALEIYEENTIIKGKRKNRRLMEAFFTFGMQLVTFFVLKYYLDDINAQPKLFSRKFYEEFIKKKAPHDFSLDLFLLLKAKQNNIKIKDFPVFFNKRMHGEAKGGGSFKTRIKLIKRTLSYIFEMRYENIK